MNLRRPLLFLFALVAGNALAAVVDPAVHRTLRSEGTVDVIVSVVGLNQIVLNLFDPTAYSSRSDMITALTNQLIAYNLVAVSDILAILLPLVTPIVPLYVSFQNFWISNQIFIQAASPLLIDLLVALPSVGEVRPQMVVNVERVQIEEAVSFAEMAEAVTYQWGVNKIQAPSVIAAGFNGQGIRVGSIDTGVLSTHQALAGNFGGNFSWYDAENKTALPYDANGHGTHTMGTLAGAGGIGVAPGATWMTCKGCRSTTCPESDLLACGQFMLCPTNPAGTTSNCGMAPRIVSNSWGGGQGGTWYSAVINAWVKVGIVPVFAIGNSGPACATAQSPGDYANVIGVGSSTSADALSSFSCKGPSLLGPIKPDISAPGSSVYSAWNTGNTAYATASGTSMSTPHVAGALTLMLSANPNLSLDSMKSLLLSGTDRTSLNATNYVCNGTTDTTWPNNQWGNGRLNAYKGYLSAVALISTPTPTTTAPAQTTAAATPTTTNATVASVTSTSGSGTAPTSTPETTTTAPTPTPTPTPTTTPTPTPKPCDLNLIRCVLNSSCTWNVIANTCNVK